MKVFISFVCVCKEGGRLVKCCDETKYFSNYKSISCLCKSISIRKISNQIKIYTVNIYYIYIHTHTHMCVYVYKCVCLYVYGRERKRER